MTDDIDNDGTTLHESGGVALPEAAFPTANGQFFGMSLRDYFAAKAMQGMYADVLRPQMTHAQCAANAYTMADCMLRARLAPPTAEDRSQS